MSKPALGRGLGALLGGSPTVPKPPPALSQPVPLAAAPPPVDSRERIERVAIARICPCTFQPRKDFSEEALRELADSIREQGIVQPLIVRRRADQYELIAGERRWRAAQMARLADVPVIVREADDRAALELALIENLQRENLNPIEEAQGYSQLIQQFQLTQEEAAVKVGKSRAVVANALRLLKLAPDLQAHVRDGRLSVGHAKVILGLARAEEQNLAADRVLKKSLNVRQTEELIAQWQHEPSSAPRNGSTTRPDMDAHVAALAQRLQERLGTKVDLRYRQGKGALRVHFYSDDDLERVLDIVGVKLD
jgi:ParB family chromosome partitioning protein